MASSESSMEAHLQLYEIFLSEAKPMNLQAAIFLNIPDIITIHGSENHLSVEEIASHISTSTKNLAHIGYLFRIIKFLASIGVFIEETTIDDSGIPQFKYGPTNLSKLLSNIDPHQSCAPTLLFLNLKSIIDAYGYLHDSVIEGCQAFTKANGMDIFKYDNYNPETNKILNEAMTAQKISLIAYVLKVYDGFKSFKSVVDVGGGLGSTISIIVNQYMHIHGINFDLPHVIRNVAPIKGVEHVESNMFEKIPLADAIFMKRTLHDWDDELCLKILKKSYEAIPENGKVLIVDAVIEKEEGTKRRVELLFAMLMMTASIGGKERTKDEFKDLIYKAGFKSYSIIELPFYKPLIEVSK